MTDSSGASDGQETAGTDAARAVEDFPAGPWVFVVGMHRSGTSALTGVLGALGLALPFGGDLLDDAWDNPNHYESRALAAFDDTVLDALGGTWPAPPELVTGWERAGSLDALVPRARVAAHRAYPDGGPLVWKDPRLCLLLPFWRAHLDGPMAALFVWRSPLAVARSLHTRDGSSLRHGIALWHHYNRSALAALSGLDVLALGYDDALADPTGTVAEVAAWLDDTVGPPPDGAPRDLGAAAAVLADIHRHQGGEGDLPEGTPELVDALGTLRGRHRAFVPPDLPACPGWVDDTLAALRAELHRDAG